MSEAVMMLNKAREFVRKAHYSGSRVCELPYGHFASGGSDDRIESTLPPVFRPKVVPRS